VEGETLLIVESEDHLWTYDQRGDSLNSEEGDVLWMEEQLSYFCDKCQKWIPASQLREQLSYLKGDNFFRFTCSDCSADGKEQYERLKLTWQQVSKKLFSRIHWVDPPRNLLELLSVMRNLPTYEL
jgi:hypothetical protein